MTNDEIRMTNQVSNSNDQVASSQRDFDLEERTAKFGESVIRFMRTIRIDAVTEPLVKQLVRSSTSIGANYCEANDAETRKVFRHRIAICRKEAKETRHWLRMPVAADQSTRDEAQPLWQEAKELNLIFSTIHRNSRD